MTVDDPISAGTSHLGVAAEWKFAADAEPGTIEGYGAVFGNIDDGGDLILPGAFRATLRARKSRGGGFPIYIQHGFGADGADPVGRWTDIAEDARGLKVKGRLSGMDTDRGRFNHARVMDGTFGGLSIGYSVRPENVKFGREPGEPRRTLKAVDLVEISLVDEPMNALSRISARKARAGAGDTQDIVLTVPVRDGLTLMDALAFAIDAAGLVDLDAAGPVAAAKALLDRKAVSPAAGGDHAAAFWAALSAGLPR